MEQFFTYIGVPEAKSEAERVVQAASAGAASALGGAGLAKTVQTAAQGPVTKAVTGMMAQRPGAQAAGGAGAGAAAQTAAELGLGPGAQFGASLAGGVLGSKAVPAGRVPKPGAPSQLGKTVSEAEARGIPVLTSDVAPPQTFVAKTLQQTGERLPIGGTGPIRVQQQQARSAAISNELRQFGADDAVELSPNIIKDLGEQRASQLAKYSSMKGDVIAKVSEAGGNVPLPRAMAVIDEQIANLSARRTDAANEAIERLQKVKSDLQNRDLSQLEAYRADELSNAFKDDPARPISIAARDIGEKALRKVYDPVRQDMGDFIKATGERRDFDKWMIANKRLSEMAGEVQQGTLKSVLKSGNATPEVVERLLFSAKPSEVRQLYAGLSQEGRANARTAILAKVAKKAQYENEAGEQMYKPDVFANEIKRLKPQLGVFFSGKDGEAIEGLTRVLDLTRRAGQAGVSTASGQQAVPFAIGSFLSSIFGGVGGAIAAAGGAGAAARIYESAPVRNLMISLSKTKRGAPEEAQIFKRLSSAIQAQQQTQEPPRIYVGGVADQQEAQ
jgi:hypothetical protein